MEESTDINRNLMLDANAIAEVLYEIFGVEMTAAPTECADFGIIATMGTFCWHLPRDLALN